MKKTYKLCLGILAGFVAIQLQADAAAVWTGAVDNNWSVSDNWAGGVPGEKTAGAVIGEQGFLAEIFVDEEASGLGQIVFDKAATSSTTLRGELLRFDADTTIAFIKNDSSFSHTINNDIQVGTSDYDRNIIVGAGLTFNGSVEKPGKNLNIVGYQNGEGAVFNGPLKAFDVTLSGRNSLHAFSNTVDNEIKGQLRLGTVDGQVFVDTAADTVLFAGKNIQINSDCTVTLNNANVIGDKTRLTVGAVPKRVDFYFNADEAMGPVRIVGKGLSFHLGDDVKTLSFKNSSKEPWASGITIHNFRSGVIGFDPGGLTEQQIDMIKAYDAAGDDMSRSLELDLSGRLISPDMEAGRLN